MSKIIALYRNAGGWLDKNLDAWFLQLVARFGFAAVLFMYFWNSAMTKIGPGLFGVFQPTTGAYAAILPAWAEAVSYDVSQLGFAAHVIVISGTIAEVVLPILIVLGLLTRVAALGMIFFVIVQSYVDIYGHHVPAEDIGRWFDGTSDALILDQRLFWAVALLVLVVKGGGRISLDYLFGMDRQPDSSGR